MEESGFEPGLGALRHPPGPGEVGLNSARRRREGSEEPPELGHKGRGGVGQELDVEGRTRLYEGSSGVGVGRHLALGEEQQEQGRKFPKVKGEFRWLSEEREPRTEHWVGSRTVGNPKEPTAELRAPAGLWAPAGL